MINRHLSPFSPQNVVVYFTYFGGRYLGRQMSRAKFLSDRQIFLSRFDDQNRRRLVVDQFSLWKERPLAYLWRQIQIHCILTLDCLHQIGCLCYCCCAKTSSSAVQKRHSKVYGNPITPPSVQFSLEQILIKVQTEYNRQAGQNWSIKKIEVVCERILKNKLLCQCFLCLQFLLTFQGEISIYLSDHLVFSN